MLLPKCIQELQSLHQQNFIDPDPSLLEKLRELNEKVQTVEQQQAKIWRSRSQVPWITLGDVPSIYFSAHIWAKQARDTLHLIQREDGTTCLTDTNHWPR